MSTNDNVKVIADDIDLSLTVDLSDELSRLEIEDAISRLSGIEAVRLVPGANRPVDELHVVVTPERDPKHTARDLQTLLFARFGIDVDRRVISVVRIAEDTGQRLRDGLPRLTLDAVHIAVRANETSVGVELLDADDVTLLGCAGPVGDADVVMATAEATLDAVVDAVGDKKLRLHGAKLIEVGADLVAVVSIAVTDDRHTDVLTGSAAVRRNEADAVARAVLDATNRLHRG